MNNKDNQNKDYLDDFGLYATKDSKDNPYKSQEYDLYSQILKEPIVDEKQDKIIINNTTSIRNEEKEMLLEKDENTKDIGMLFLGFGILFFVLIVFMPQIYLANNIYYASKNINYLRAQKEALIDENMQLQQKLENKKFNFLTLEIDEIE
ncbi:MAG: hypothetical protein K2P17_03025 [Helicobacteraceae bacterium]|nr:hypothetical protein [Helicobacteraceae bacterium]